MYMDQEAVFYVLVTLVLVLAAYIYVFPQFPDVAPVLLQNQSSIAPIRSSGETAIYRSKIAGHDKQLMSGLAIADADHPGQTRDGHLGDLWKLASENCKVGCANILPTEWEKKANEIYQLQDISGNDLKQLVSSVGKDFQKWCGSGNRSVAIVLPNCLETFVAVWAAVLFKVPVVIVPFQGISDYQLNEAIRLANPAVILSTNSILKSLKIDHGDDIITVSTGAEGGEPTTATGNSDGEQVKKGSSSLTWTDLCKEATELKNPNIPEYVEDANDFPISLIYVGYDKKVKITHYTNQNIVSAVAAQIKALPKVEQWTKNDTVLCCNSSLEMYGLVLSFAAVVQGCTLVFPLSTSRRLERLIRDIKPSILVSDDHQSFKLIDSRVTRKMHCFCSIGSVKLQMAMATLSRGNIPAAVEPHFRSVRLVYSAHSTLDFLSGCGCLNTEQTNLLRAVMGAKVIHSLTSPVSAGAIAQSYVYDYRRGEGELVNYGSALPSNELVLRDHGPYSADDKKGQLWVRGCSLPSGVDWVATGVVGVWGKDGALKLYS